ncbi:RcpC/CpaB family pilus assembly protein [Geodermatophilus sp. SYSU D00815]
MIRRLLAALAALVLAAAGGIVLVAYVRGADARAAAGLQTVEVLVVQEVVPAGTPAEELAALVDTELVPRKTAVADRVTALADLVGQVATVDLQPGEQLLASRFSAPSDLRAPGTVEVPAGLQEVSVLLDPQRAVGGRLAAGDTVGVYLSLEFEDGTATTHGVLHGVLVTQVQGAPAAPAEETETASASSAAPTSSLLVTLAVLARDAEAVVFGAEHGSLWLSLEPEGADTSGTQITTQVNVYAGRPE